MKTKVMGQRIKRNYKFNVGLDNNGKLKYKPYIIELCPDIQWEEICSYEGEPQLSEECVFCKGKINISEEETVVVTKQIFRADIADYYQYTDKVLEDDEGNKAECEEALAMYMKQYNKEMIENNPEAKSYCDLHKLNYEETDYDELMNYIKPNKADEINIGYLGEKPWNLVKGMDTSNKVVWM